jgi:hypothetical protein
MTGNLSITLRHKAERKFQEALKASLHRRTDFFPLRIPYPRPKSTEDRKALLAKIEAIKVGSKEVIGQGYTVEWVEINTRKHGRNQFPGAVSFACETDFFGYLGKIQEVETARFSYELVIKTIPALREIILKYLDRLCQEPLSFWKDILHVVRFFQRKPFPGCFARELPLEIHTKFVEREKRLIENFVKTAAPNSWRAGDLFEDRLGLLSPEGMVELRLLDPSLARDWPLRHFHSTPAALRAEWFNGFRRVIITENRIPFLTLPELPATIAILGHGYAATRLERVELLKSRAILYWGDMDAHGFHILSQFRARFPQVQSVLMDKEAFEHHEKYAVEGKPLQLTKEVEFVLLKNLSVEERFLYQKLNLENCRLEQERIHHTYAIESLRKKCGD